MSDPFDARQTAAMTRALLRAVNEVIAKGAMNIETEAHTKSVLAEGVVAAADKGEHDEDKLTASALAYYAASQRTDGFTPA